MNKKIALVIPSIDLGGAEIQMIWQIQGLRERGYQVYLVVLGSINENYLDLPLPDKNILCLNSVHTDLTGKATILSFKLLAKISTFIVKENIKIVIANLPLSHYVMRLVKFNLKLKGSSFCLLNYHHALQFEESSLNTLSKKIFNKINSSLSWFADDVSIFISEAVQRNIQQNSFAPNPYIIYNGIPQKQVKLDFGADILDYPGTAESAWKVVIPGRLNKTKGHLFFIDSFAKFVNKTQVKPTDIQVIFAGEGELFEEITDKIDQEGLNDYFYITGYLPNDQLLSLIKQTDLVAVPSLIEGLGNVAIEALMVGKLILASDAGGLQEVIIDNVNGFSFRKGDEAHFLSKLEFIYKNKNNILIDKTRIIEDYENRFSFESHISKLIEVINTCAE